MQMISRQDNYFRTTSNFSPHDLHEKSPKNMHFSCKSKVNCSSKIIILTGNHVHICNGQGMRNPPIPLLPIQNK